VASQFALENAAAFRADFPQAQLDVSRGRLV
jgi:Epoxide hydrolase N terminus